MSSVYSAWGRETAADRGQAAFAVPGISHEPSESISIAGRRRASYRVALRGRRCQATLEQ